MKANNEVSLNNSPEYNALLKHVGDTLERGRQRVAAAVGSVMVRTYWEIGRQIVEYEQQGNAKAEYGADVVNRLSRDLKVILRESLSWMQDFQVHLLVEPWSVRSIVVLL